MLEEKSWICAVRTGSATRDTTSDWSLLERIVEKDEEALAALYDRYSRLIFSEAKRILHRTGEAEEILQDMFYQVWETAERFDAERGSLAGWLLVATRNRAIAKLRKKNWMTEGLDENGVAFRTDIESHADQNSMIERVRGVLENLPKSLRAMLELAYFEGVSCPEIAAKTGAPLETVKAQIQSGMEELNKVLG